MLLTRAAACLILIAGHLRHHNALASSPLPPFRGPCPLAGLSPDVLFGGDERGLPPSLLPMIGNGYVATQIDSPSLFVAGVYTGSARSPSHRMALPSPMRVSVGGELQRAWLDTREAVYVRRSLVTRECVGAPHTDVDASCVTPGRAPFVVETRAYAHRVLRHVMVYEAAAISQDTLSPPRADAAHSLDAASHARGSERADAAPALRVGKLTVAPSKVYAMYPSGSWGGGDGRGGDGRGGVSGREGAAASGGAGTGGALRGGLGVYGAGGTWGHLVAVRETNAHHVPDGVKVAGDVGVEECAAARAWASEMGVEGGAGALAGCASAWTATLYGALEAEEDVASGPSGGERSLVLLLTDAPGREVGRKGDGGPDIFDTAVTAMGAGVTHVLITVAVSSWDLPTPPTSHADACTRLLIIAGGQWEAARALSRAEILFALHATAWREGLWRGGVEVAASVEATASVEQGRHVGAEALSSASFGTPGALTNASLYALLSSVRADWPFGLGPGGLSSNGYNAHTFWDTESFAWQALNLLHPDIGASLLAYRLHRLPGSRAKARANGVSGAQVPWESAFTGVETAPEWAPTGDHEIHVSGDVAIAVAQHAALVGDAEWSRRVGWPLLRGIAEFWAARALADTPDAALGGPDATAATAPLHIRGVIAPTEFYRVDDNTFTNCVAKLALELAAEAAGAQGMGGGGALNASTPAGWSNVASRLVIPFDTGRDAHPYFANYTWGKPVQLLDVPMLGLLLGFPMSSHTLAANVRAYLPLFEGGAAFSYAVNAIAAAEIGLWNTAQKFLAKNVELFVDGPYRVWSEYPHGAGCPNFVTGAAGWLQALVFGFVHTRVTLSPPGLHFRPALPRALASITVRSLALRGHRVNVAVNATGVLVSLATPSAACAAGVEVGVGVGTDSCPQTSEDWERALLFAAVDALDTGADRDDPPNALFFPPSAVSIDAALRARAGAVALRRMGTSAPLEGARAAPPRTRFDPDDPTATPAMMVAARPWLSDADERRSFGSHGNDCVVVTAKGKAPVVLKEGAATMWLPAGPEGLSAPDAVGDIDEIGVAVGRC